jgi:hypothetical protein
MAVATGRRAKRAPMRINPPAIPNRPERNEVAVTMTPRARARVRDMAISVATVDPLSPPHKLR